MILLIIFMRQSASRRGCRLAAATHTNHMCSWLTSSWFFNLKVYLEFFAYAVNRSSIRLQPTIFFFITTPLFCWQMQISRRHPNLAKHNKWVVAYKMCPYSQFQLTSYFFLFWSYFTFTGKLCTSESCMSLFLSTVCW